MSNKVRQLVETNSKIQVGASHTCKTNVEQFKKGLAANYKSIIGSKKNHTDANFTANTDAIYWSDYNAG